MKIKLTIWIFLLTSVFSYSQTDSLKVRGIEIKSIEIDNGLNKLISKQNLKMDSIKIEVEHFESKFKVTSDFENSGSQLLTEFYYDKDELILIRFTEPSTKFNRGTSANKITEYYYDNGKLIDKHLAIQIPNPILGIGMPKPSKWDEVYGYNQNLKSDFLKSYAELLLNKITK